MELVYIILWFLTWIWPNVTQTERWEGIQSINVNYATRGGSEWGPAYGGNPSSKGSILEVIRQAGGTTFLSLAQRCPWIIHELGGQPGYTALVPTNKAFDKLPRNIAEAMNSSAEVTEWYLRYHIAMAVVWREDMTDNRLIPSAFKPPQTIDAPVQQMRINVYTVWNDVSAEMVVTASGAPVIKADLAASNGVVHIIDKVMYPVPTGSDAAKYLQEEPQYSMLYAALQKANMTSTLSTQPFKPLTIFAPSNEAFGKLNPAQAKLLQNVTILQRVLAYHVVMGSYYRAAIYNDFQLHPLEGSTIYFEVGAGGVSAEGKQLENFDTTVTNGVVHELAGVMFPTSVAKLLIND